MTRRYALPATVALAAVLAAGCGSTAPAQRVHAAFSKAGYPAHSVQRSKDQVAAARLFCGLMVKGTWTYPQAVTAAMPAVHGSRAKATAFVDAAISSYCPEVKR